MSDALAKTPERRFRKADDWTRDALLRLIAGTLQHENLPSIERWRLTRGIQADGGQIGISDRQWTRYVEEPHSST